MDKKIILKEESEFYAQSGYLIREQFLDDKRVELLRNEAESEAQNNFTNILDLHRRNKSYYQLITDPLLLQLADELLQARMIPIGSIFFFCKPNNPLENGSNMHQDNYAAKAPFGSYLVVGVSLDRADEANGSLIVCPGSHTLGELPSTPSKNFDKDQDGKIIKTYPIGNAVEIPKSFKSKQLDYSEGSLLFIHGHTIHGAPKNPHPTRWRRMVYLHFIKDGHPYWPGWNARRMIMDRDISFEEFNQPKGR